MLLAEGSVFDSATWFKDAGSEEIRMGELVKNPKVTIKVPDKGSRRRFTLEKSI
jgi:hypothetical protein